MIKEALAYLVGLGDPKTTAINGLQYYKDGDEDLILVEDPTSSPVGVRTLSGFVDLISAGIENLNKGGGSTGVIPTVSDPTNDDVFIIVIDHLRVELASRASDKFGRRRKFAFAVCDEQGKFGFGNFMAPEAFIIGLQSCFVEGVGDTEYLIKIASNLTSAAVSIAEDNGVSQQATVRKSVVLADNISVKSRVTLAPFRTFREADQPASDFVFRLRNTGKEGEPPMCALFEADGGAWKNAAMQNVAKYLSVAIDHIPVIS